MEITASKTIPGRTDVSITPHSDVSIQTASRDEHAGVTIHNHGIGYSGVKIHMENCGLAAVASVVSLSEGKYVALQTGDGSSLFLSAEQARVLADFVNALCQA